MIDIRRSIETLIPDAKCDFSIPNEGGTEEQYNNIVWTDNRKKPTWNEIIQTDETNKQQDLQNYRENLSCGPLQIRRALRALNRMDDIKNYLETAPEEVKEAWEYATIFPRLDPLILEVQQVLEATDEDVDELFELALTFP